MATQGNATSANAMNSVLGMMNTAKEKWDSSGANEALGRLHASIPQSTRDYVSTTSAQVFSRKQVRSITVTFGIGEERPFYVEKSPSLLMARLRHNLSFFVMNYLIVAAIMFCLTLLGSPSTLIGIGLVIAAWFYVLRQSENGAMKIGSVIVSQKAATIVMGVISAYILYRMLSTVVWYTLVLSGLIVLAHAGLRDASMHQDTEDKMDMVGEVGEDSAFLGPNSSNPV